MPDEKKIKRSPRGSIAESASAKFKARQATATIIGAEIGGLRVTMV
jgi:hypothetical protein